MPMLVFEGTEANLKGPSVAAARFIPFGFRAAAGTTSDFLYTFGFCFNVGSFWLQWSKCGDAQTHAHIRATLVESGIIREIRAWFHQALGRAGILTCFRLFKPVKVDSVCVCVCHTCPCPRVRMFVFVCVCVFALAGIQEIRRF